MNRGDRICRGFVDLDHGQVHLRRAGVGSPLVLVHQSPGSSKQLEPLMRALATRGFDVIAPDTAGNGDSDPLPLQQPEIPDLAAVTMEAVAHAHDGPFHLYGSHTGASIAMEIALADPDRIQSLTIDGMGLYDVGLQSEVLARYARKIRPDAEATHLMKVWHFCRDQFLFWPYYNRTAEGVMRDGLPDDDTLHDLVVEVLKAMRSYHLSYRAAFRHPKRDRLPRLRVPVHVICSPSDMLHGYFEEVAALIPGSQATTLLPWSDPRFHDHQAEVIARFIRDAPG
jgi:pimeloyl-ACP methyl ester carboxylesterase